MVEYHHIIQIIITVILTSLYYKIKYSWYDLAIKGYKNYAKDLVKEWIDNEKWKQELLWNIVEKPECIKYIRRHLLKENKRIEKEGT